MYIRVRKRNLHGLAQKEHKAGELTQKCQAQMYLMCIFKKCFSLFPSLSPVNFNDKKRSHYLVKQQRSRFNINKQPNFLWSRWLYMSTCVHQRHHVGQIINFNYNSFKFFPQFRVAKSTRIIHHTQLLVTEFRRILCLTRK